MIINTYLYSAHVLPPGREERGRRREERGRKRGKKRGERNEERGRRRGERKEEKREERKEERGQRKEERREERVLLPPALRVYKSGLAAPVWMIIIMMC